MNILVVGSGGREHALCWKISKSPLAEKIFCAPGNAGTARVSKNIDIKADQIDKLLDFALSKKIGLTVIGPEAPLVEGIADVFKEKGLKVFGPSREAARLEGSKSYAKELMRKYKIPTAEFEVFDNADKAKGFVLEKGAPIVIKADGLAAGKGVTVAGTIKEALEAIDDAMVKRIFGEAGGKVVIEEALSGEEASILSLSDGKDVLVLESSQDHKRVFEGDKGPNTGGMGAYSPAPIVNRDMYSKILKSIIRPMIEGMYKDGIPYTGVLYAGIMVTEDGPKVLEFNVRFGDPETQAVLPRMKTDLVELMNACVSGGLPGKVIEWDERFCVAVVLVSEGYPGKYKKGYPVLGLEYFDRTKNTFCFHAGTKVTDGKVITDGGRVLNVVGLGSSINEAIDTAYQGTAKVNFDNIYFRNDIAFKAIGTAYAKSGTNADFTMRKETNSH